MVAEGDDDIAHQLYALVPLAAEALLLLVTGRLGADDAAAVKRTDIGGAARHMHKADVVGVALADEGGVLIVQPLGRNADGRPLVGGALGVAAQPLHRAVDAQAPVFVVAYGAEAGRQLLGVGLFAVYKQLGLHGVEVGVVDAPGMSANPTITGNLLIHTFHCKLKSHSRKRFWDYDTFVV